MLAKIDVRRLMQPFGKGERLEMMNFHERYEKEFYPVQMTLFLGKKHYGKVSTSIEGTTIKIGKIKLLYMEAEIAENPNIRLVMCSDFNYKSSFAKNLSKLVRGTHTRNFERSKFMDEVNEFKYSTLKDLETSVGLYINETNIQTSYYTGGKYCKSTLVWVGNQPMISTNGGDFQRLDPDIRPSNVVFTLLGMDAVLDMYDYISETYASLLFLRSDTFLWSIGNEKVLVVTFNKTNNDIFASPVKDIKVIKGAKEIKEFISNNQRQIN